MRWIPRSSSRFAGSWCGLTAVLVFFAASPTGVRTAYHPLTYFTHDLGDDNLEEGGHWSLGPSF